MAIQRRSNEQDTVAPPPEFPPPPQDQDENDQNVVLPPQGLSFVGFLLHLTTPTVLADAPTGQHDFVARFVSIIG